MLRPSFSLTLLASFLLIAGVLGAAAASGWMALEQFAREGRERSTAAITLNASVQQLAERSVDLERSARQYLVLEDEAIRERFFAARDEALRALAPSSSSTPRSRPWPTRGASTPGTSCWRSGANLRGHHCLRRQPPPAVPRPCWRLAGSTSSLPRKHALMWQGMNVRCSTPSTHAASS